MGQTIIEKILGSHAGRPVSAGDMVDITIDARVARDFGGANVVKNLVENGLDIADPSRTFFTFDCNPGGSDQNYASNQQKCRQFARQHGLRVYDIDAGIGTHLAIDAGLVGPGETFVSTDSHANILGAIGAFGQGMGDQDIAHAFAYGTVWFVVPPTIKVTLSGMPAKTATPKDVTLALCQHFGANGLLGYAAEFYGPYVDQLDLPGRVTLASMCTEMGGIIMLFPPNPAVIEYCRQARERFATLSCGTAAPAVSPAHVGHGGPTLQQSRRVRTPDRAADSPAVCAPTPDRAADSPALFIPVFADAGATYEQEVTIAIADLRPMIAKPGNPEDVVPVAEVAGTKVDSVFIGSCTNGRYEDLAAAAQVLNGRHVAPGVVLKVVPATDAIWRKMLDHGLLKVFKDAGALVANAGCGGCAAGQIGQNGPGEVTISTGNRNFPGKQGKGSVYLASPETAAASAIAGVIATVDAIPAEPVLFAGGAGVPPANRARSASEGPMRARSGSEGPGAPAVSAVPAAGATKPGATAVSAVGAHGAGRAANEEHCSRAVARSKPTTVRGRVWVIRQDNIDTDMIYHNRHLTVTDIKEMGQYAFGNLAGWQDFAKQAKLGDIVVVGKNFGCGSSRQQAVDCFATLGISAIVGESFGAIYERNAINAGLAILCAALVASDIENGEEVEVDFTTGVIRRAHRRDAGATEEIRGKPFSDAQLKIYERGGLLAKV